MNLELGITAFESQDYKRAIVLLTPLAQSGNAEAQCLLGNCYQLGLGIAPDQEQALKWYRAAAEQGNAIAANNLAGILLISDRAMADYWFSQAREKGFEHTPGE